MYGSDLYDQFIKTVKYGFFPVLAWSTYSPMLFLNSSDSLLTNFIVFGCVVHLLLLFSIFIGICGNPLALSLLLVGFFWGGYFLVIEFVFYIIPYGVLFSIIYIIDEKEKEKQIIKKNEKQRQREIEQEKRNQEYCLNSIISKCEESIDLFEVLPIHLETAEKYIDQAEVDFKDRAYAPFWDSIEKTINEIGRFDENINKINNNISEHKNLVAIFRGTSPQFPISKKSISRLSIGENTSRRLRKVVRTAQTDFEFATIYEQRKTNQILVAGFNNLARALEQMTRQISDSIGNLQKSVKSMSMSLNSKLDNIHTKMDDIIISSESIAEVDNLNQKKIIELVNKSAEREKRALAMLDNLQRHREPSIFNQ